MLNAARPALRISHGRCARCAGVAFINAERVCLPCLAPPATSSIDELIAAARAWPQRGGRP